MFSSSKILHAAHYDRQGFALDYKLDAENLTISVGGQAIPILNEKWASGWDGDITGPLAEHITVLARTGDTDGANLPWFPFADSVLLFWWIHKEAISLTLALQWKAWPKGLRRLEIHSAGQPAWDDPLLSIEIQNSDPSTMAVSVPEMPLSSSPSSTYPLRVALIHVIAPTAVLVNDLIGNAIGVFMESMLNAILFGFAFFCYAFMIFAVVFSLWRCFRGPSFEDTVGRLQSRLERLSQNERLRELKIEVLRENLEFLVQNERFMAFVNVCRNGWHPERDRAIAAEENAAADIERGLDIREEGEAGEKEESIASKK